MARELESAAAALVVLLVLSNLKRKAKSVDWSDDEMRVFLDAVRPTGINPEHALLVFTLESGLQPEATSGSAWGINQAQGPLLRAAGFRAPAPSFAQLSVSEQLPFVGKMLTVQVRSIGYVPQSAAELQRVNLSPAAAIAHSFVIYTRERDGQLYTRNAGLDHDAKGSITLDDLQLILDSVARSQLYQRHLKQLRRLNGSRI